MSLLTELGMVRVGCSPFGVPVFGVPHLCGSGVLAVKPNCLKSELQAYIPGSSQSLP